MLPPMKMVPSYMESPRFLPALPQTTMRPRCIMKPDKRAGVAADDDGAALHVDAGARADAALQTRSPPRMAAPKVEPAFFSMTTVPAIMFSAQDQPTRPLMRTFGPSMRPTPK